MGGQTENKKGFGLGKGPGNHQIVSLQQIEVNVSSSSISFRICFWISGSVFVPRRSKVNSAGTKTETEIQKEILKEIKKTTRFPQSVENLSFIWL